MLKNNLLNRRNKEQLMYSLETEQYKRITCSFYRYIKIEDLSYIRNQLYAKLIEINILGKENKICLKIHFYLSKTHQHLICF